MEKEKMPNILSMGVLTILLFCFLAIALFTYCTIATDTISINQTIRDGETIVSAQEAFELGFFSLGNTSQNRYLGIRYKNNGAGVVVWVANREAPISNKSGELTLNPGGLLVLRDSNTNQIVWSSGTSRGIGNAVAQLLDNSNLIVLDSEDGPENYIWQSFDHPGNTQMPEMKFGRNLKRGIVTNFTSWKSDDDPSPGPFMIYMDFNGYPQTFENIGDEIQCRLGSWNDIAYSGSTNNQPNPYYRDWFYMDDIEAAIIHELNNKTVLTRLTLSATGKMEIYIWNDRIQKWFLYSPVTTDGCENYARCGVHGICDIAQNPNCGCLRGFRPKRPDQWEAADWTSGCQRNIPLDCGVGEGFQKYPFIKLPDTRQSWFDRNMSWDQCKAKCTSQCNCTAFATLC